MADELDAIKGVINHPEQIRNIAIVAHIDLQYVKIDLKPIGK